MKKQKTHPNDRPLESIGPREHVDPLDPEIAEAFRSEQHIAEARSGQQYLRRQRQEHATMDPTLQAGDVEVPLEDAALVGEEVPGGDNPTPDQSVVEEIGRAAGVEYQDNEPLRPGEKLEKRDDQRWELDPASAEDYEERTRRKK